MGIIRIPRVWSVGGGPTTLFTDTFSQSPTPWTDAGLDQYTWSDFCVCAGTPSGYMMFYLSAYDVTDEYIERTHGLTLTANQQYTIEADFNGGNPSAGTLTIGVSLNGGAVATLETVTSAWNTNNHTSSTTVTCGSGADSLRVYVTTSADWNYDSQEQDIYAIRIKTIA